MTPRICRAARALLDLSRAELAELADISERVIAKFEGGDPSVRDSSVAKMREALEAMGVAIICSGPLEGVMVVANYADVQYRSTNLLDNMRRQQGGDI